MLLSSAPLWHIRVRGYTGGVLQASPRVSVVIPTHNRPEMLERALRSVLAQTYQDFEVVVVDDGSAEPASRVVERLSDQRVRVLRLDPNRGMGRARNAGIAETRGEWVAFLDDDDEWLPEKLSLQMARLDADTAPKTAVVYCYCNQIGALGISKVRPKDPLPEGDVFKALVKNLHSRSPSAYVIKRSVLLEVGSFDPEMPRADDIELWFRMAVAGHHFVAVQEALVIKHEHGEGQVTRDPIAGVIGFRELDRRWGPAIERRLGKKARRKWRRKRFTKLANLHAFHVARLAQSGSRAEALRYARRMLPYLPWGARVVAQALAFGLVGLRIGLRPLTAPTAG